LARYNASGFLLLRAAQPSPVLVHRNVMKADLSCEVSMKEDGDYFSFHRRVYRVKLKLLV